MITQIRKGLQSQNVRYAVTAFIVGTFAFSTIILLWQYATEHKSNWVIKVNDTLISKSLYMHEYGQQDQLIKNLHAQYGDLAQLLLQMSNLPTDVASLTEHSLIQSTLLNEQAEKAGIIPSPTYVQEQVANPDKGMRLLAQVLPLEVFSNGSINNEQLARYLTRMGLSSDDLERLLEQSVARAMLLDVVSALTYVPQFYLAHENMLNNAERTVSLATAQIVPSNEIVTPDEVEQFYQEQIKMGMYTIPEKRSAKVWRFDPDSYQIKVGNNLIKDYYEQNKQTFVQDPAKLTIAYAIFNPNEQFDQEAIAEAAQELHDTVVTTPDQFEDLVQKAQQRGINVQFEQPDPVERGELVDRFGNEFDRRIFALAVDNSIAPVIDTPEGIVIVQRLQKQKRRYKPFSDVEDDIRSQIREERFASRFTSDVMEHTLSNKKDSFDEFYRKHNAKEQVIAHHKKGDNRYDQYIFSAKQGEYVPFVDGQVGVVIEVTDIEPESAQELSTIKKQVESDLRLSKGRTEWNEKVNALMQELKDDPDTLEERAIQNGFTFETVTIPSDSTGALSEELSAYAIDPDQLRALRYPGALTSSEDANNVENYAFIARLDTISEASQEGEEDEKKTKMASSIQKIARSVQNGYVATLRKNATIEVNSSLSLSS